jgi:hypothetical protein
MIKRESLGGSGFSAWAKEKRWERQENRGRYHSRTAEYWSL